MKKYFYTDYQVVVSVRGAHQHQLICKTYEISVKRKNKILRKKISLDSGAAIK